jgi:hypothetical protein
MENYTKSNLIQGSVNMIPKIETILQKADRFEDNEKKKSMIYKEISILKNSLKNAFIKKIKVGKINKEITLSQMELMCQLIKEYNKIQVYSVKNGIVIPRNTHRFPELHFKVDLTKSDCNTNLTQLAMLIT